MRTAIPLPLDALRPFCRKWHVKELAVFGSILRADFRPDSDVDVLVTFCTDEHWSLFDLVHMEEELAATIGRKVHLTERETVERSENWIRREAILGSAEPVYVS